MKSVYRAINLMQFKDPAEKPWNIVVFSINRSIRERIGYYRYLSEVIEYNRGGSEIDLKSISCGEQRSYLVELSPITQYNEKLQSI